MLSRLWSHKQHSISCPSGRAMGCPLSYLEKCYHKISRVLHVTHSVAMTQVQHTSEFDPIIHPVSWPHGSHGACIGSTSESIDRVMIGPHCILYCTRVGNVYMCIAATAKYRLDIVRQWKLPHRSSCFVNCSVVEVLSSDAWFVLL